MTLITLNSKTSAEVTSLYPHGCFLDHSEKGRCGGDAFLKYKRQGSEKGKRGFLRSILETEFYSPGTQLDLQQSND